MQVTNIFFPKNKFKAAQPQDPCRLCSSFYFRYDSCQTDFFSDPSLFTGSFARSIKARVKGIEIFGIQLLLHGSQCFTETLEMDYLSCPKETDGICNLRDIFHHPEDIIVGGACLGSGIGVVTMCLVRAGSQFDRDMETWKRGEK